MDPIRHARVKISMAEAIARTLKNTSSKQRIVLFELHQVNRHTRV